MHRVKRYVLLTISDISSLICSRVGQIAIKAQEKYQKSFQVLIYLETVALGGLNKNDTCDRVNPFFNQLKYMNSCSFAEIFSFGPDLTSSEFVYFSSDKCLEVSWVVSWD